jgi:hypothetical protein
LEPITVMVISGQPDWGGTYTMKVLLLPAKLIF